jgi:hypothetical protein
MKNIADLNGEEITVKFLQDCQLEVILSYDEKTDHAETALESFSKDESVTFDVFDVMEDVGTINVQFGDGSCIYGLPINLIEITEVI